MWYTQGVYQAICLPTIPRGVLPGLYTTLPYTPGYTSHLPVLHGSLPYPARCTAV